MWLQRRVPSENHCQHWMWSRMGKREKSSRSLIFSFLHWSICNVQGRVYSRARTRPRLQAVPVPSLPALSASFSGDIQDPPGRSPVQPAVGDPSSAGGLDLDAHRGPFQPLTFCDFEIKIKLSFDFPFMTFSMSTGLHGCIAGLHRKVKLSGCLERLSKQSNNCDKRYG